MKICKIEGCNKKFHAKEFCGTHYASYRKSIDKYKENNEYIKGNLYFEYKDRNNWSISIKAIFGDKCMICGWNEDTCDVHHIIPYSMGGKNTLENAIVLCPNHHKLADNSKIDKDFLYKLNNKAINGRAEGA